MPAQGNRKKLNTKNKWGIIIRPMTAERLNYKNNYGDFFSRSSSQQQCHW